ncbi:MAG: hypothetical protein IT581_14875 [Verrucomicrobiales bacterium]|nr:hypothetical protein [Verrucomicrobiales bacterium]
MKKLTIALWATALLACSASDPAFVTSDPNGGWSEGGYYLHNNMWSRANFTSGTVNLLEIMKWVIAKGWLTETATLNQICYGVEVVSTDDEEATFEVTSFSIEAKSKPSLEIRTPATNSTPVSRFSESDAQTPR